LKDFTVSPAGDELVVVYEENVVDFVAVAETSGYFATSLIVPYPHTFIR
jgi:hypothetical protein